MKNKITLIIKKGGRKPEAKSLERTEEKRTTLSAKKNSTLLLLLRIDGYFTFLFSLCKFFPKTCMFVMSMVPICLPLFRFTNYSCNHHYSIALVCTEKKFSFLNKKNSQQKSLKRTPAVGVMQMQKLRPLCWEHRAVNVFFPFKAGSRSEYSHTCFTCCLEFLACPNFYLSGSFTYTFILYCLHFKLH